MPLRVLKAQLDLHQRFNPVCFDDRNKTYFQFMQDLHKQQQQTSQQQQQGLQQHQQHQHQLLQQRQLYRLQRHQVQRQYQVQQIQQPRPPSPRPPRHQNISESGLLAQALLAQNQSTYQWITQFVPSSGSSLEDNGAHAAVHPQQPVLQEQIVPQTQHSQHHHPLVPHHHHHHHHHQQQQHSPLRQPVTSPACSIHGSTTRFPQVAAPSPSTSGQSLDVHTADRYQLLYRIGGGAFSSIHTAFDRVKNANVAIKIIEKVPQFPSADECEYAISIALNHPNIIRCFGRYYDQLRIHLVFELAPDGDLFDRLESPDDFRDADQCEVFMVQAATGLQYIHSRGIVHLDVKLENMLVSNTTVKLCDFGLSGVHGSVRTGKPHGTTAYMAPELAKIRSPNTRYSVLASADVWAFAIVLYTVIFADLPWDKAVNSNVEYSEFLTSSSQKAALSTPWCLLSRPFCRFLFTMMSADPTTRPTMDQVCEMVRQPWLHIDPTA